MAGFKPWPSSIGSDHSLVWPDWAIFWTLGNLLKPLATINLPQFSPFLSNLCKGVKSIHFSSETFLGNFYRHLAIFIWSQCHSFNCATTATLKLFDKVTATFHCIDHKLIVLLEVPSSAFAILGLFFIFAFFKKNEKLRFTKSCQRLASKPGTLFMEVTVISHFATIVTINCVSVVQ